jgi:hypothetical protein
MKKLSPSYFGWSINFLSTLSLVLLSFWAIYIGFNYESKVVVDITGYGFILTGLALCAVELWEMFVLLEFLRIEINRVINLERGVIILRRGSIERKFELADLREIEFGDEILGSRAITANLTYSKLKFKSGDGL